MRKPAADGDALRESFLCLAVAVTAALLTLFFFSPRFVFWRALNLPHRLSFPECHRALDTMTQLDDPWQRIENQSNRVIGWRLFFPLIWHYARLPRTLLLAMPQIGCLLALWLTAWVMRKRLADWPQTWMATTLFAALPWFFVATGWLAYFDSWLVLGLLVAIFVPSRVTLALACLLTPWIDERFVIALPATVAARAIALARVERGNWRDLGLDLAVIAAASLPYPAVRGIVWLAGDADSSEYVAKHWQDARGVPLSRYLEGLFSGYRAAWIMIAAAVWFWARATGWKWGVAFALIVLLCSIGGLLIAADMSRTLMIECPFVLLGIWLWHKSHAPSCRFGLAAVLAANLLLPAQHVIWPFTVPIRYLYAEMDRYRVPPPEFQPGAHAALGNSMRDKGDRTNARKHYDVAIALDPKSASAYAGRAALNLDEGNLPAALSDANSALGLQPDRADALLIRAILRGQRGENAPAIDDARRALQTAPQGSPLREGAEAFLEQMTDERSPRSIPPATP
jgi:tetratricopeptide (TPR) repeat protein